MYSAMFIKLRSISTKTVDKILKTRGTTGPGHPAPADTLARTGLGKVRWGRVGAGRRIALSYPEDGFYRADEKTWFPDDEVGYQRRVEVRWVIICPWQNFEFDLDNGPPPASLIGSACRLRGA